MGNKNLKKATISEEVSSRKTLSIGHLPGVRARREEMLNNLGYLTLEQVAKVSPEKLWNQIIETSKGKEVFQRLIDVKKIVYTARSLLEDKPKLLSSDTSPLNLQAGDAFYDTEYKSHRTDPKFFSISIGVLQKDGNLAITNWFAENYNKSVDIIREFYEFIEDSGIKIMYGWGNRDGDNSNFKKVSPLPAGVTYCDLFHYILPQIVLPVHSTRLKAIYSYITHNTSPQTEIDSGRNALMAFNKYLKTKDLGIKQNIIEYNQLDVEMVYRIALWFNFAISILKKDAKKRINVLL